MAKAVAICKCKTCGCDFKKEAFKRSRREADSWEAWALDNFNQCDDCRKAEELEEAKKVAKENNLPDLTGSVKQIAWAEKIRAKFIESVDSLIAQTVDEARNKDYDEAEIEKGKAMLEWLRGKALGMSDSRFWIENRNYANPFSLCNLADDLVENQK